MTRACVVWHELHAARVLRDGGVIVHATEAVFGLGCLAAHRLAAARVATLKHRPAGQGFIVLASTAEQLEDLVNLESPYLDRVMASWPGPCTWILPARRGAPTWLTGPDHTLAVRVTAHLQAAALCQRVGPMISTSANPAGREPARTLLRARCYFGAQVDFYLPGAVGARLRPSTIRDARTGAVVRR